MQLLYGRLLRIVILIIDHGAELCVPHLMPKIIKEVEIQRLESLPW